MMTSSNRFFLHYWPFVWGFHQSPVNYPHKGQWRGALMFSLICAWINDWVSNQEAGDLRCHRTHYDVTVMVTSVRGILWEIYRLWHDTDVLDQHTWSGKVGFRLQYYYYYYNNFFKYHFPPPCKLWIKDYHSFLYHMFIHPFHNFSYCQLKQLKLKEHGHVISYNRCGCNYSSMADILSGLF